MATPRKHWFRVADSVAYEPWSNDVAATFLRLSAHLNTRWAREGRSADDAVRVVVTPAIAMQLTGSGSLTRARRILRELSTHVSLTVDAQGANTALEWPKWAEFQKLQSESGAEVKKDANPAEPPPQDARRKTQDAPARRTSEPQQAGARTPEPLASKQETSQSPEQIPEARAPAEPEAEPEKTPDPPSPPAQKVNAGRGTGGLFGEPECEPPQQKPGQIACALYLGKFRAMRGFDHGELSGPHSKLLKGDYTGTFAGDTELFEEALQRFFEIEDDKFVRENGWNVTAWHSRAVALKGEAIQIRAREARLVEAGARGPDPALEMSDESRALLESIGGSSDG